MIVRTLQRHGDSPQNTAFRGLRRRAMTIDGRDLRKRAPTEIRLRDALVREKALLLQRDGLIQQQEVLSQLLSGGEDAVDRVGTLTRESARSWIWSSRAIRAKISPPISASANAR